MIRGQDINFQDESLKKLLKNLIGRYVFQDSQKIRTSILNEINIPLEEIVKNLKKPKENNRPEVFFFFKILESSRKYLKKKFWLLP